MRQALTSLLMSWMLFQYFPTKFFPHDNIYNHEVHQPLQQQNTHTVWYCMPCTSQLGWRSQAFKLYSITFKSNEDHYDQMLHFIFIRPKDMSLKIRSLSLIVFANCNLTSCCFWDDGFFFILSQPPVLFKEQFKHQLLILQFVTEIFKGRMIFSSFRSSLSGGSKKNKNKNTQKHMCLSDPNTTRSGRVF